jgi:hypothetical protein
MEDEEEDEEEVETQHMRRAGSKKSSKPEVSQGSLVRVRTCSPATCTCVACRCD